MSRLIIAALFLSIASPAFAQQIEKTQKQKDAEEIEAIAKTTTAVAGWMLISSLCMGASMLLLTIAPIAIAIYRGHPDTLGISLIAIFFSWSCIGWWIALIWAVKAFPRQNVTNINIGDSGTGGDFDFR